MIKEIRHYGFLTAIEEVSDAGEDTITFEYGGNMGNNMESVDRCLEGMGYAPIDWWKAIYSVWEEDGHPSYWYVIKFWL